MNVVHAILPEIHVEKIIDVQRKITQRVQNRAKIITPVKLYTALACPFLVPLRFSTQLSRKVQYLPPTPPPVPQNPIRWHALQISNWILSPHDLVLRIIGNRSGGQELNPTQHLTILRTAWTVSVLFSFFISVFVSGLMWQSIAPCVFSPLMHLQCNYLGREMDIFPSCLKNISPSWKKIFPPSLKNISSQLEKYFFPAWRVHFWSSRSEQDDFQSVQYS